MSDTSPFYNKGNYQPFQVARDFHSKRHLNLSYQLNNTLLITIKPFMLQESKQRVWMFFGCSYQLSSQCTYMYVPCPHITCKEAYNIFLKIFHHTCFPVQRNSHQAACFNMLQWQLATLSCMPLIIVPFEKQYTQRILSGYIALCIIAYFYIVHDH